jgi:putative flavoprotein involved in K+ transport
VEMRGVVDNVPGLFFCGLAFQYAFSSMVFPGIGRDAEYLARRIGDRVKAPGREHLAV